MEFRSREISDINKSVQEINDIFMTLSDIIAGQTCRIETFGGHIEETIVSTEGACKELGKSNMYSSWVSALTMGLIGGVVAGPVGFIVGIESSVVLLGLSVGSGYISYKVASAL